MTLGPLMMDLQGTSLQEDEAPQLRSAQVGGVILFARNFETRSQLQALVAEIRAQRPELLVAVDQEGGRVQRFKEGFTRLPPMQAFYRHYKRDANETLSLVEDCGWLMAAELLACDLDFSFAPVLDVDCDNCSVIADRAFADDPAAVTALAGAFIRGMHDAGMASTGKHFPGHGAVTGDSHLLLPVDTRDLAEIQARDWLPFTALSKELDGIMPAHIHFPKIDEQPVGFSRVWLQELLRGELGYTGVIFSDDLSMEGAAASGGYAQRAALALQAGCDMVLACNNPKGATEIREWLERQLPPLSPRLTQMRRRKTWDWEQLQQQVRWRATSDRLQKLVNS